MGKRTEERSEGWTEERRVGRREGIFFFVSISSFPYQIPLVIPRCTEIIFLDKIRFSFLSFLCNEDR